MSEAPEWPEKPDPSRTDKEDIWWLLLQYPIGFLALLIGAWMSVGSAFFVVVCMLLTPKGVPPGLLWFLASLAAGWSGWRILRKQSGRAEWIVLPIAFFVIWAVPHFLGISTW